MSSSDTNKKRKRTKNTTNEQYQIYLEAMESDYHFRSNTINPTLPPKYIDDKWEAVTLQLNGVGGDGPVLSPEQWKKRFTDWKYATKSKLRNIKCHANKTGGGPSTDIKLSPLEDRALDVWGRVTVDGAKHITPYEGIQLEPLVTTEQIKENPAPLSIADHGVVSNKELLGIEDVEVDCAQTIEHMATTPGSSRTFVPKPPRMRAKPLSLLAETLIHSSKANITTQTDYVELLKGFFDKYIEIERAKLDFKINKMKFLHPEFPG